MKKTLDVVDYMQANGRAFWSAPVQRDRDVIDDVKTVKINDRLDQVEREETRNNYNHFSYC